MQEEKTFILEEQFVLNKFVPKNHSGEDKRKEEWSWEKKEMQDVGSSEMSSDE
jgi:hypothetical protein